MNENNNNPTINQPGMPPTEDSHPEGIRIPPKRIAVEIPKIKPWVTYILLGLTILIYLMQQGSVLLFGEIAPGVDFVSFWGMKINIAIQRGQLWRLFTPMVLHGSVLHIGFNMYALYVLGQQLERFYGPFRFLLLYIIAGFAGNVASFILSPANSLGASTAVFGLIAAQGIFIYKNRSLFGNKARSMLMNIGSIVMINLILGLSPGIDNWGHLGGLIGGLMFAWFSGPILKIKQENETYRFADSREKPITYQVFFGLLLLFSVIAAFKIL
ncbi:MAG: rhomboid family intramembrane serine protease [Anaerolineaceae bacterium]|nr:rhomboid family intramembrane serine protease [Anaerolineaceae bacterium]